MVFLLGTQGIQEAIGGIVLGKQQSAEQAEEYSTCPQQERIRNTDQNEKTREEGPNCSVTENEFGSWSGRRSCSAM